MSLLAALSSINDGLIASQKADAERARQARIAEGEDSLFDDPEFDEQERDPFDPSNPATWPPIDRPQDMVSVPVRFLLEKWNDRETGGTKTLVIVEVQGDLPRGVPTRTFKVGGAYMANFGRYAHEGQIGVVQGKIGVDKQARSGESTFCLKDAMIFVDTSSPSVADSLGQFGAIDPDDPEWSYLNSPISISSGSDPDRSIAPTDDAIDRWSPGGLNYLAAIWLHKAGMSHQSIYALCSGASGFEAFARDPWHYGGQGGMKFEMQENIGRLLGFKHNCPERMTAILIETLRQAEFDGHVGIPYGQAVLQMRAVADKSPWPGGVDAEAVNAGLKWAWPQKRLISNTMRGGEVLLRTPEQEMMERKIAAGVKAALTRPPQVQEDIYRIKEAIEPYDPGSPGSDLVEIKGEQLATGPKSSLINLDGSPLQARGVVAPVIIGAKQMSTTDRVNRAIMRWRNITGNDWALDASQIEALHRICESPIFVMTGGAGTGKSTVTGVAIHLPDEIWQVRGAAPTGRAAVRLGQTCRNSGMKISTIHALLQEGEWDPQKIREITSGLKWIFLDEGSMIPGRLCATFFECVDLSKTNVGIIADINQLQPVGAGAPVRDMMNSGKVPVLRLKTTHRQGKAANSIADAANAVLARQIPQSGSDGRFSLRTEKTPAETRDKILKRILVELPEKHPEIASERERHIQAISLQKKGEAGVNVLNHLLKDALNPAQDRPAYFNRFRQDDKVIITQNAVKQLNVVNGDVGFIVDVSPRSMTVEIDDGDGHTRIATLPAEFASQNVEFGYALTCHKYQGSQAPHIVSSVTTEAGPLLNVSALYTAITRGAKTSDVIGQPVAIARACADNPNDMRHTRLCEMIERIEEPRPDPAPDRPGEKASVADRQDLEMAL